MELHTAITAVHESNSHFTLQSYKDWPPAGHGAQRCGTTHCHFTLTKLQRLACWTSHVSAHTVCLTVTATLPDSDSYTTWLTATLSDSDSYTARPWQLYYTTSTATLPDTESSTTWQWQLHYLTDNYTTWQWQLHLSNSSTTWQWQLHYLTVTRTQQSCLKWRLQHNNCHSYTHSPTRQLQLKHLTVTNTQYSLWKWQIHSILSDSNHSTHSSTWQQMMTVYLTATDKQPYYMIRLHSSCHIKLQSQVFKYLHNKISCFLMLVSFSTPTPHASKRKLTSTWTVTPEV